MILSLFSWNRNVTQETINGLPFLNDFISLWYFLSTHWPQVAYKKILQTNLRDYHSYVHLETCQTDSKAAIATADSRTASMQWFAFRIDIAFIHVQKTLQLELKLTETPCLSPPVLHHSMQPPKRTQSWTEPSIINEFYQFFSICFRLSNLKFQLAVSWHFGQISVAVQLLSRLGIFEAYNLNFLEIKLKLSSNTDHKHDDQKTSLP